MPLRADGTWFHDPHPILQPIPDIPAGAGVRITKGKHRGKRGTVLRYGSGIPEWIFTVDLGDTEWWFSEDELDLVTTPQEERAMTQRAAGKTVRQIAEEMGVSPATAWRRLGRAERAQKGETSPQKR